jgi:hypothetical protein
MKACYDRILILSRAGGPLFVDRIAALILEPLKLREGSGDIGVRLGVFVGEGRLISGGACGSDGDEEQAEREQQCSGGDAI